MPDEVLMPVSKPDALVQAEIHAIRQVSDVLAAQTRAVERLGEKVDDVRERVIRIEEQQTNKRLDAQGIEVDKLKIAMARLHGLFLPVGTLGAAVLGGAGVFLINKLLG